jgi:very-short-patch-repair endonuclease
MRHESTDAEKKLWSRLRNSQLAGHKFRRQVPLAGFIVDFYCLKSRLIVEVDGGQHYDSPGRAYDGSRDAKLRAAGLRILRYSDVEVLKDTDIVLADILKHLQSAED